MVYADVNILGGSVHTVKNNTEAWVVANKDIGLEVIADETKYMVISPDQNAEQSDNICIKADSSRSSSEMVEGM
jgi:hypothetical protein